MNARAAMSTAYSLALVLVWLCGAVLAQPCAETATRAGATPSPTPTPSPSPPPWYQDRYAFYSEKAPITNTLKRVPGVSDKVDRTLDKLRETEDAILKAQSTRLHDSKRPRFQRQLARNAREPLMPTCNLEDNVWRSAAASMVEGLFNRSTEFICVTDVFPEGEDELEWHDLISDFRRAVNDSAILINDEANAGFGNPDTVYNFPYDADTERCVINAIGAFRVDDVWFVNVAITNELKSQHLRDRDRHFLVELMGRNGTHAKMTLGVIPANGDPDAYYRRSDSSTLFVSDDGPARPDFFKPTLFEDNIALTRALEKSFFFMQQAHEARSASSIAILFLPLFLNILPIALFADVSRMTMFVYAVLSDVLTTLPLAIKGIELILTGMKRNVGVVVRMTSNHNATRTNEAAAEVYTATCQSNMSVTNAGIAFLVIAMVCLVGGLVLELVFRHHVQKRRRKFV